ncbi:MAG: hypothetical protein GY811_11080 [Myxococcales bacterium]|nr:hypothetical protein [Myxococcales bacterium]
MWWSGENLRLGQPVNLRALHKASKVGVFDGVLRLGKYLLLDMEGRPQSILVHLGMSGRFRHFSPGAATPPHTHVEWGLEDGRILRFSDPRRFGDFWSLFVLGSLGQRLVAKIHPKTPASRLIIMRCERLVAAVRDVLERALMHGGTSMKDFVAADGHAGKHSHYL